MKAWLHRVPWPWVLVVGVATVAALAEARSLGPFAEDDSYITFEFSKNLARGNGPVYGHGMVVEGYSNFLWMVLVAIPLAVSRSVDPIVAARAVAVPFLVAILAATCALSRRRTNLWWGLLAATLVAVNQDTVLAFLSGLETIAYTAFITVGLLVYLESRERPDLGRFVTPIFAAAALTRIDGFVPLGCIIVFEAASAWMGRRFSFSRWVAWALPGVVIWGLWFAWRFWYYGLPLPSTYYAKALIPVLLPNRGRDYVFEEFTASGLWLSLPAAGLLWWRNRTDSLLLSLFAVGQILYAAHVGGDWMPFGRFIFPAVPALVVLLVSASAEFFQMLSERGVLAKIGAGLVSGASVLWIGVRVEGHASRVPHVMEKLAAAQLNGKFVASLKDTARYLGAVVPEGGRMVTDFGGVLAYYTEATPIEMWGLCNATIAQKGNADGVDPIFGRTCPACYPALDPEYFHVGWPVVRTVTAFAHHKDVVGAVWQADTIGRYLDVMGGFASGRVTDRYKNRAAWFLERRRPGWKPRPRHVGETFIVEYPFDPGGLLADQSVRAGP